MEFAVFVAIVTAVTAVRTVAIRAGKSPKLANWLALAVPSVPALIYTGLLLFQLTASADPSVAGAGIVIPAVLGLAIVTGLLGISVSKALLGDR